MADKINSHKTPFSRGVFLWGLLIGAIGVALALVITWAVLQFGFRWWETPHSSDLANDVMAMSSLAYTICTTFTLWAAGMVAYYTFHQISILRDQVSEARKQSEGSIYWEIWRAFSSRDMYEALDNIYTRKESPEVFIKLYNDKKCNDFDRRQVVNFLDTLGALEERQVITIEVLKNWFSGTPKKAWDAVRPLEIAKALDIAKRNQPNEDPQKLEIEAIAIIDKSPAAKLAAKWEVHERVKRLAIKR